jgi:hypothetical protein
VSSRPDDPGDALRTPLQAIRTAADIILAGEAGPIGREALLLVATIVEASLGLEAAIEQHLRRPPANEPPQR